MFIFKNATNLLISFASRNININGVLFESGTSCLQI